MWSACLLSALILAAPPAGAQPAPAPLAEVWTQVPAQELLEAAIARRAQGDLQGARERLLVVAAGGQLPELSRYQLAASDEVEERFAEALEGYEAVIAMAPELPLADDARYRRAIVLEDLGRHAEAVQQITELERRGHWGPREAQSLELVRGAAQVRAGLALGRRGLVRKGIARIEATLAALEGTEELPWARARARLALAQAQLKAADAVEIRSDGRARRSLVARAGLLEGATDQVIAIANLGEPEPALVGLLLLGDAYLDLHADLLAAPPPPRLDAEQRTIYEAELAEQVGVLEVKAWRLYDQGVSLATRLHWQGRIAGQLEARRASVQIDP